MRGRLKIFYRDENPLPSTRLNQNHNIVIGQALKYHTDNFREIYARIYVESWAPLSQVFAARSFSITLLTKNA